MRSLTILSILSLVLAVAVPASATEPPQGPAAGGSTWWAPEWVVEGAEVRVLFGDVAGQDIHLFDVTGAPAFSTFATESYFEAFIPHAGQGPSGLWLQGLVGGETVELSSEHWDWGD